VDAKTPIYRVEPADELLNRHLDRLEAILAQKDAEVRRLKTELDLRILYTKELHAQLQAQVVELTDLDHRVRMLEKGLPHSDDPVVLRVKRKL
jgi:hypothetical protein